MLINRTFCPTIPHQKSRENTNKRALLHIVECLNFKPLHLSGLFLACEYLPNAGKRYEILTKSAHMKAKYYKQFEKKKRIKKNFEEFFYRLTKKN